MNEMNQLKWINWNGSTEMDEMKLTIRLKTN